MGRPTKKSSVPQPISTRDWSTCLRRSKQQGASTTPYMRRCAQQQQLHLNFMGCPRSTTEAFPRPTVSSSGSITNDAAKEQARIFGPLVGRSPHYIKNMKYFVDHWETTAKKRMCLLIWCLSTIHISATRPCHQHFPSDLRKQSRRLW